MYERKVIRVFVALADNKHQGIVPVPAKIGNGDDAANNLYWGCSEGLKSYFNASRKWRPVSHQLYDREAILERRVYQHIRTGAVLVADAYRGSEIRAATVDFLAESVGTVAPTSYGTTVLASYIGHNGLMDFAIPSPTVANMPSGKDVIVLCCKSRDYFTPLLRPVRSRLLLTTTQLMYPGSFLLHDALEVYLAGGTTDALREQAARAYARNQKIGVRAARWVFG